MTKAEFKIYLWDLIDAIDLKLEEKDIPVEAWVTELRQQLQVFVGLVNELSQGEISESNDVKKIAKMILHIIIILTNDCSYEEQLEIYKILAEKLTT